MSETFDTEAILKDVLEVLRKHAVPVQTVALDISMFDDDFDVAIPQLQTYRAGIFYKPMTVDGTAMLFQAKRRIPFDDLARWLEQNIIPPTQQFATQIKAEYPNFDIQFEAKRGREQHNISYTDTYAILVECDLKGEPDEDYNRLQLSIHLRQMGDTNYPTMGARVGWLIDRESDGSWGIDEVHRAMVYNQEALRHMLTILERALPSMFSSFERELKKRL